MQIQKDKYNQECQIKVEEGIQSQQQSVENSFKNIDLKLEKKQNGQQNQQLESQPNQELKIQENNSHIQQLTHISTQSKSLTYQLIKQNSIKQEQYCNAIAINFDCSILVAGCGQEVKVFEFNQAILKQVQLLSGHSSNVITLNFMMKQDQFISGSSDHSIIIWGRNHYNLWICNQKLNGHKSYIQCLALNNNEDVIASGDNDNTIKIWNKQNEWSDSQVIRCHTQCIFGLSFNEQQNRLISCGGDKHIFVIELSEQKIQWIVIQKIELEESGVRLCFIDNNAFALQLWGEQLMLIFEMNTTKEYVNTKNILTNGGNSDSPQFPLQYIKQKCILVNKNGSIVSLIRKQQNGEFTIEQSFEFGTQYIFGCMSIDGQYLITWDFKSKEYQIRKYLEQ